MLPDVVSARPLEVCYHAGSAVGTPDLIALRPDLYALRFETMKVLSARAALRQLLADGVIGPGSTVIDSSSGIYALALALAAHEAGVRCKIIGSTSIDATTRVQLELLGADLEQMPPTDSLQLDQDRRVARVREILDLEPDTHWMRQYHDPIHDAGYVPVGEALGAGLAAQGHHTVELVAAVGTGVSSYAMAAGVSQVLPVRVVGVQPFGSVTFGSDHLDDPDMLIAGIGSSIPFANVRHERYDIIHWVSSTLACSATTELMRRHALFAGLSTGACWAAAEHERSRERHHHTGSARVILAPDTGHRYVEKVYAPHATHPPFESFAPVEVASPRELARPWSRAPWRGRCAPPAARVH